MSELLTLAWSEFSTNISETFQEIRKNGDMNDVTLVCDNGEINAHKLVLYSGSTFFQSVLTSVQHEHPLIYIKGVKLNYLKAIVDFMYNGEISIAQDDLKELLETAEDLKIKGLSKNETKPKEEHIEIEETFEEEPLEVTFEEEPLEETFEEEPLATPIDTDQNDENEVAVSEDPDNGYEEIMEYEPEVYHGDEQIVQQIIQNEDLEDKALDLMERVAGPNNRVTWFCKVCKKNSSDKTRIRKHVVGKHLRKKQKNNEVEYKVEEKYMVSFKEDDQILSTHEDFQAKVFSLMEKVDGPNNRITWFCRECKKNNSDKTRIRKHVEIHIEELLFSCLHCDTKRKCSCNMDVHIAKAHSSKDPLLL
eukprot:GFUD01026933.1.p1 GENE.GFUD01026933.1~~GFUD01026933.1.p1  ORF type:complete len:363 (-),score=95.55 GFUD01026933.1:97-1185(-)